jgi:hypothetical protein
MGGSLAVDQIHRTTPIGCSLTLLSLLPWL